MKTLMILAGYPLMIMALAYFVICWTFYGNGMDAGQMLVRMEAVVIFVIPLYYISIFCAWIANTIEKDQKKDNEEKKR